ncbi:ABC transporter ATP-binding protein [Streptomyces millisiae]|uniref:ABC transporter ATP-binding protein n=1 Tax=Streptomyces millisiae TaxID=3075542 RepID=A0ABU2LK51_9ACTN|nr:ABC transporter ATP-binding protein [Streptomyces sp. DSM 44918]MDT0317965.1 ABC transporter ATP-binding protein [Streptomyces sp. DSM 44918]
MGRLRGVGAGRDREEFVTESERLLFGGRLRYDMGWSRHDDAVLELTLRRTLVRLPQMVAMSVRLAWAADRRATRAVALAEVARGVAQAVMLLSVQAVLVALLEPADVTDGLRDAMPAIAVMTVVGAVGAVARAVSTYADGTLQPKVERHAQERYLERALGVELQAIEDHAFHKLLESAQFGASSARRMIGHGTRVISALLSLAAAAGVLAVLHPVLMPMLLLMTMPSAWSALTIARRRYQSYQEWVQHSRAANTLSRLIIEADAAAEVRVHGVGPFLLRHFRAMSQSYEGEQARLAREAAGTRLVASALTGATALATYLVLGGLLWSGAMEVAAAGAAVVAIRTGSSSLDNLIAQVNSMHEDSLFVTDLHQIVEQSTGREIPVGGAPLPERPESIEVEGVTFAFPGTEGPPALRGVSLTIPVGRVTALVGENGSGKSTLIKLLCGLYRPQAGRIRFGGQDIAAADRQDLFSRFAVVGQDFYRWPFTARVNVAVGRTAVPISEERLEAAAAQAGAGDVVAGLPHGWGTLLSRVFQRGHQLSGGQWQKLGIARAAYRDAPILIVDEPTAALDARAEQEVFDRIRALADAGRTVVLITHRMASVRDADLVHVLHGGRLVESGTPDELLRGGGRYAEMYGIQAAQFARSGAA